MLTVVEKCSSRHGARMSLSLHSVKGAIQGILWGSSIGLMKGDTRTLDEN